MSFADEVFNFFKFEEQPAKNVEFYDLVNAASINVADELQAKGLVTSLDSRRNVNGYPEWTLTVNDKKSKYGGKSGLELYHFSKMTKEGFNSRQYVESQIRRDLGL